MTGIGIASLNYFIFESSNENQNVNNLTTNDSETNRLNSSNVISSTPSPTPKPDTYHVRGVAKNDVLYIRPAPGNLKVKVRNIPHFAKGGIITGKSKKVGKSNWVPVNYTKTIKKSMLIF